MLSIFLFSCEKQIQGCIDPIAINNNPETTYDYRGCIYSENQYIVFLN